MMRSTLSRGVALLIALSLAACAAYQSQHAGGSVPAAGSYAAPSTAPSREFTELPADAQVARVRGETEEVKERLAAQGKYACCVTPACNECLLRYGECHCREAARHAGPCCGECTEAWVEGRGAVEGVSSWELLERKKEALKKQGKAGAPVWEQTDEKPPASEHDHSHQHPHQNHH